MVVHRAGLLRKMFDTSDKEIRRLSERVAKINALEPQMERLSDDELRGEDPALKRGLEGESLDDILPEAFAAVRRRPSAPSASATTTCS